MSNTKVDMPKVAQMLDSGWQVTVYKNDLGSYAVSARHASEDRVVKLRQKLIDNFQPIAGSEMPDHEWVDLMHFQDDGDLFTDDFTPEQALTRMAYKVFGEII